MAWKLLSFLLLSLIGVANASTQANENDFENHPTTKRVPMRSFSLSSPYLDSDMSNRWFDFGGDTVIRADRFIRLTADRPSQSGWIFSRVPLTATNWQVEVDFAINGEGTLHGDGMAMWLTEGRASQGPVFGSADRFKGLGIFIDTYKNGRQGSTFPLVMAMLGDGHTAYDKAKDGQANEIASCSARGIRGSSYPTKLRLTYFQDKYLALDLQYKSDMTWTSCFKIQSKPESPINLPAAAYLGFSAETGELSDTHDILEVDAFSLYTKQGSDSTGPGQTAQSANQRNAQKEHTHHVAKSEGSWLWFFFKVILFFAVIAGAYVGWTVYRTAKSRRF
ncbi:hypothetical protein McanMca71_004545 [Microsporum canis]|uniref:Lectin n=1 Tax=Arthroderma otae (strain ATCC MYA-4605 / CBS 113480) TaxID=554155 RepID=C5FNA9_ARTOC|nr:lectin [Microsporum canis CBS 113480]EEQ31345.1 lectin [Microsporum canis CBS 113480]